MKMKTRHGVTEKTLFARFIVEFGSAFGKLRLNIRMPEYSACWLIRF